LQEKNVQQPALSASRTGSTPNVERFNSPWEPRQPRERSTFDKGKCCNLPSEFDVER
jgi:hypothetical protein